MRESSPEQFSRNGRRIPSRAIFGRNSHGAHPTIQFVGFFTAFWLLSQALLGVFPKIETWIVNATVSNLVVAGNWVSQGSVATGPFVRIGGANLQIVPDCTPLMSTIMLWCAIVAFPSAFTWKIAGLLSGAAILWVYNLLRVLALAFILSKRPALFEFVHVYLWQSATVFVVFSIFALWLYLHQPRTEP